jgi:hypothetical protein
MKRTYDDILQQPHVFQSLTGIRIDEFEALLGSFGRAWEEFVAETFQHTQRQRAYGGGRKPELQTLKDKLLFILVYFRLYPTQAVQGFLFGMSQGQANVWGHRLTRMLSKRWATRSNCLR